MTLEIITIEVQDEELNTGVQLWFPPDAEMAKRGGIIGGSSTRINPHRVVGWACFPNWSNIQFNDTDESYTFINFWNIAKGMVTQEFLSRNRTKQK